MEKNANQFMLWICCALTGYPFRLLSGSSYPSKRKVITLAFGMLIIMTLNTISALIFFREVLATNTAKSVVGAGVVLYLSFLFEQMIIHSDKGWGMFLFRSTLTLLMGTIFSIGIDLSLSRDDIVGEVQDMRFAKSKTVEAKVEERYTDQRHTLKAAVQLKEQLYRKQDSLSTGEATGLTGSRQRGTDQIYKALKTKTDLSYRDWREAERELLLLERKIADEKQLAQANHLSKPVGPWERIQALHQLIERDEWTRTIYWFLFAIFIIFDFSVLIVKMFSKKTSFEYEQELIEVMLKEEADSHAKRSVLL